MASPTSTTAPACRVVAIPAAPGSSSTAATRNPLSRKAAASREPFVPSPQTTTWPRKKRSRTRLSWSRKAAAMATSTAEKDTAGARNLATSRVQGVGGAREPDSRVNNCRDRYRVRLSDLGSPTRRKCSWKPEVAQEERRRRQGAQERPAQVVPSAMYPALHGSPQPPSARSGRAAVGRSGRARGTTGLRSSARRMRPSRSSSAPSWHGRGPGRRLRGGPAHEQAHLRAASRRSPEPGGRGATLAVPRRCDDRRQVGQAGG